MKVITGLVLVVASAGGASFDSHARETVMVAMRDGVRLATDIYRPARRGVYAIGRFPVIIARTPYNKEGERAKGEFFAREGYIFVAQDCRGFFASGGRFNPIVHEGVDGYDTIEWAASQGWSNRRIGTVGASYLALVQYAAMVEQPPHLEAVYAAVGPTNYYRDAGWRGGIPGLNWPVWIANAAAGRGAKPDQKEMLERTVREPSEWLRQSAAARRQLLEDLPDYLTAYEAFYRHPFFDEHWRNPAMWPEGFVARMKNVPALLVTGWYDSFAEATLRLFRLLSAKAPAYVVVGPWPHAYGKRECGEALFPENTVLDERALQLAWFDRWLKKAESSSQTPAPVRYYVMGGGRGFTGERMEPGGFWRESPVWPPSNMRPLTLYLDVNATLTESMPAKPGAEAYTFDPSNPTPVAGGRYRNGCIVDVDTSPLRRRDDIVRFSTAPLQAPIEIAGPISLELNVRTSARDADFIARLVDVWPDGYAMPVVEGQIRLSRRTGGMKSDRVKAGDTYAVALDLGTTALLVPARHRLRLDIASAAFPALEPNAGTGEDAWLTTGSIKAEQTIVTGGKRPSRLVLTVSPMPGQK
jgi:putative CocE/NonD family hydrolase